MRDAVRGLIGRDAEIERAGAALAAVAAGSPRVLLVGGDAGIGKTTLAAAIADAASDQGFTVLIGHCLDVDDGSSLGPVREALRPVAAELVDSRDLSVQRLVFAVGELSDADPVVLVLEDMHWADRATIDIAAALARTATGRLCLVLTYRADEINRRHPFRQALAELVRAPGAVRMPLAGLDREQTRALVALRAGVGDPDVSEDPQPGRELKALADAVYARSEGNPLYAEELLAAGREGVPEHLSDLLLARVDLLSEQTRALLRLASAHGSRLWPELLSEASGSSASSVDAVLREAVEANVLVRVGDHLDFRHGLLREAVYADLMPGERAETHRRLAEALQGLAGDQPTLPILGLLSHHWYAARDVPAAFDASLRAGPMAWEQAWLETATHLERALELYDQVPEPGIHKADLLRMLASGVEWTFDRERSRQLVAEALELVEGTDDPLLAARIYTSYAVRAAEVEGGPTHEQALERAIVGLQGRPSEELAKAYSTLATVHLRRERISAADAALQRALEVVATLDVPREEADTWRMRGWCAMWLGDLPAAADSFATAARICRRTGMGGGELLCESGVAMVQMAGLDPEKGIVHAEEIQRRARDRATDIGAIVALERAGGLVSLGRFVQAQRAIDEALVSGGIPADDYLCLVPQARLHLARGDAAAALAVERRRTADYSSGSSVPNYEWTLMHIQVLLANGLAAEALERAREWLTRFADSDGIVGRGPVAHGAYLAVEAGQRAGLAEAELVLEQADAVSAKYDGQLAPDAQRSFLGYSTPASAALRAELHGERSVEPWRSAYDAAAKVGRGLALPVRLRLVRALLAEGERDEARTALPEVVAKARAMGALGVVEEAVRLGRRHRIPVPGEEGPSRLDVLTVREREVFDVLATGATNRVIAERLFISEKTVSVHVTNLLAKLGVANRTEAAALARDLGIHPMS